MRSISVRHNADLTLFPRIARKLEGIAGEIEQRTWALAGFDARVERVVALAHGDALYLDHLREPFFIDDRPPDRSAWIERWRQIFSIA